MPGIYQQNLHHLFLVSFCHVRQNGLVSRWLSPSRLEKETLSHRNDDDDNGGGYGHCQDLCCEKECLRCRSHHDEKHYVWIC